MKKSDNISNNKWIIKISLWTLVIAAIFSVVSTILMNHINLIFAFIILILIIMIGVFFDAVGIAVATADEIPFHSMAANKVRGAKQSIQIVRNASAVSNFFNDVIGDVCGIISGATAAAIIVKLILHFQINKSLMDIILGSIVAALTVGGKAIGKEVAMKNSNYIVYKMGVIMSFFKK